MSNIETQQPRRFQRPCPGLKVLDAEGARRTLPCSVQGLQYRYKKWVATGFYENPQKSYVLFSF
jgi:hypothetical protein